MSGAKAQLFIALVAVFQSTFASLPDQSVFDFLLSRDNNQLIFPITLKEKTKLQITILCESFQNTTELSLKYKFTERVCKDNLTFSEDRGFIEEETHKCGHNGPIILNKIEFHREDEITSKVVKRANATASDPNDKDKSLFSIVKDGIYILQMEATAQNEFNASINIRFQSPYGLLTAKDFPMLKFYGFMCLYYFALAALWMSFSAYFWQDLLRIQFWVGGVIFLGMMEKAFFYFEFHQANENGFASLSLALTAELVSCVKRTISRILVLIVSMGFGITKSRLGDDANVRISVISILYFTMAAIESYLRIQTNQTSAENKQIILSAIPLALIDSCICWWIFTSLIQTIRALKLRRNIVKLRFYNHFKNTLVFGVFMSVIFMLYSIKSHKTECNWKMLWVDQAFWHMLFSILLTVIAFLWRPNNNNSKYAFIPLLETDNDDDEHDEFVASGFSDTKMRPSKIPPTHNTDAAEKLYEDLEWVEENIVSTSMLLGDSDEEIMNTKFEISKMQ